MSRRTPRPPALSRRLLEWAARRLGTPELAHDATELFVDRARRHGEGAARRWYRRQARASLGRLLLPTRGASPGAHRGRRGGWVAGLPLDARLGLRMLVKHPGVTIVGGIAMTIGIGLGAGYLEVINDFVDPRLPFEEGDRIVGLRIQDLQENDPELRSGFDFLLWREQLESVQDLGAFRSVERNLGMGDRPGEPAFGAGISASAFRITGVPALLGRTLVEGDERATAQPVIVLGHDLWRSRFSGDPDIVGRTVRLGGSAATVVGVMPEGFTFPLNHHFWTPLDAEALRGYGPREGPAIQVFGRLAPGVTLEEARAELGAVGLRMAADHPATHGRLRPEVMKYAGLFVADATGGSSGREAHLLQLLFVTLLLILASNVATLVFARTATRENEIAMRFALGSSRGRILGQFFVEALVLAVVASAIGLGLVAWGTEWLTGFLWRVTHGEAPFWVDRRLNASTVLYALLLAVLGSLVAGVIPALKATGARLQTRLRDAAGAGESALRFGGLWSGMIVVQVVLAVLVLPPAIVAISALGEPGYVDPGFPDEEYLSARIALELERPPADSAERAEFFSTFQSTYEELERRLLDEADVTSVTFATRLPVQNHPQPWVQVDSAGGATAGTWAMPTSIDVDFFDAFGAELIAGRGFTSADLESEARVVVVNEHFVEEVLGGRNAIGRRVRYTNRFGERSATGQPRNLPGDRMREPGDWYEIVGVVTGLGMDTNRDPFYPGHGPGVYHPITPDAMGGAGSYAVRMAFHVRGDAASFAPRLREIAHAVHPELRLADVLPMDGPIDRSNRMERVTARVFSWGTALVGLIALLVSIAGTYSVLSFTVSRRTREIGIRVALGADRRQIILDIFARAMIPIGIGVVTGIGAWFLVAGSEVGLLLASAAALMVVGAAACGMPVRRALRIEPSEALREVG